MWDLDPPYKQLQVPCPRGPKETPFFFLFFFCGESGPNEKCLLYGPLKYIIGTMSQCNYQDKHILNNRENNIDMNEKHVYNIHFFLFSIIMYSNGYNTQK